MFSLNAKKRVKVQDIGGSYPISYLINRCTTINKNILHLTFCFVNAFGLALHINVPLVTNNPIN